MNSRSFSPLFFFAFLTLLASCTQHSDTIQTVPASITTSTTDTSASNTAGVTKMTQLSYEVPEGHTVTTEYSATVENEIITSAAANMISGNHESQRYQDRFAKKMQSLVVGKKISELNLHAVGGASLTTRAFEEFLASSF